MTRRPKVRQMGPQRLLRWLATMAGVCGLVLLGAGLWIPAKAALAQVLLERAWQDGRAQGAPAAPWPWADTAPVARLTLAGRSLIVLSGGSGEALAFAPSLLPGSAEPGAPGLAIIAGHRDTQFRVLADVGPGAAVEVERLDGTRLRYRVTGARVTATPELAAPSTGPSRLALVTCWPFGAVETGRPERFLLMLEQI